MSSPAHAPAETDFAPTAACFVPRWPPEACPTLHCPPGTSRSRLARTTLVVELLDRDECAKHEPTVLGAALLPLKDAVYGRGAPAPFLVQFTHKGVSVGELSGALAAAGDLFADDRRDGSEREDDEDDDDDDDEDEDEDDGCVSAPVDVPPPPPPPPPPAPTNSPPAAD